MGLTMPSCLWLDNGLWLRKVTDFSVSRRVPTGRLMRRNATPVAALTLRPSWKILIQVWVLHRQTVATIIVPRLTTTTTSDAKITPYLPYFTCA